MSAEAALLSEDVNGKVALIRSDPQSEDGEDDSATGGDWQNAKTAEDNGAVAVIFLKPSAKKVLLSSDGQAISIPVLYYEGQGELEEGCAVEFQHGICVPVGEPIGFGEIDENGAAPTDYLVVVSEVAGGFNIMKWAPESADGA